MKVRYDSNRQRVLAGGLDGQLKVFSMAKDSSLGVAYKIKMASELFALDVSSDGNHLAFGLNDGSLILKSKKLEKAEEDQDEEAKMMQLFEPTFVSKSKNYKYFYRGQYQVQPDS